MSARTLHWLFDSGKLLQKKDLYTKKPMMDFTYNAEDTQRKEEYEYDKEHRITKITKPSSKTIDSVYSEERLSSISTQEGTTAYLYACQNNLSSISKENESFSFTYDGTLLTSITQAGELNQALSFSYNNDFLVSTFSYAGQSQSTLYNKDNEAIQVGAFAITRNAQDYNHSISDGAYTKTIGINGFGEVESFADNTLEVQLKRDKNGKITEKTEVLNNKSTTYAYTYDQRGRIATVKKAGDILESYTYDNNGNRKSAILSKRVSALFAMYEEYPIFGQKLESQTIQAYYTLDDNLVTYGDNSYEYENDGYLSEKMTPEGTTSYSYGTLGELKEVVSPTKTITYLHNANNQRVAKLIDGEITEKYLWANLTTLLAIYNPDNSLKQRFEYATQRMPIAMTMGSEK
jgi:YD repeat-containing protein